MNVLYWSAELSSAACTHDAWLTTHVCTTWLWLLFPQSHVHVCLLNIRSIELQILHLNRVLVWYSSLQISTWSRSRGKAPGYVTESLCDLPKPNYALESHSLFILSTALTTDQQSNQSGSWGRCHVNVPFEASALINQFLNFWCVIFRTHLIRSI